VRTRDDDVLVGERLQQLKPLRSGSRLVDVKDHRNFRMAQAEQFGNACVAPEQILVPVTKIRSQYVPECDPANPTSWTPSMMGLVRIERVPLAALMYGAAMACASQKKRLHVFRALAASSATAQKSLSAFRERIPRVGEEAPSRP